MRKWGQTLSVSATVKGNRDRSSAGMSLGFCSRYFSSGAVDYSFMSMYTYKYIKHIYRKQFLL